MTNSSRVVVVVRETSFTTDSRQSPCCQCPSRKGESRFSTGVFIPARVALGPSLGLRVEGTGQYETGESREVPPEVVRTAGAVPDALAEDRLADATGDLLGGVGLHRLLDLGTHYRQGLDGDGAVELVYAPS